jgi:hypothetical protein
MVPAKMAEFTNAGSRTVNFAVRPEDGQWDNNCQLASNQNMDYSFGTNRFEIVLVSQEAHRKVEKILNCGCAYVIYFDFRNRCWDVMPAEDYR